MKVKALVFSENEFGKLDGKVAKGLARHSEKHDIVGIIDSSKAGFDAGEFLDGIRSGIPIFRSINDAISNLGEVPAYFIYGIAPLASFLDNEQKEIIFTAMKRGMDNVNGLPEFFTDNQEYVLKAKEYGVRIFDIRKPPARKDLHIFKGEIAKLNTPVITVSGTDCAVGKRTTTVKLVEALIEKGLKAAFIATGQTGILQGSKYGLAIDVLTSGFATGEVENAILNAQAKENPDIIGVTKVVCGNSDIADTFVENGISILADSRISNIRRMRIEGVNAQFLLLRTPLLSQVEEVVQFADFSFNSELSVIKMLSKSAVEQNTSHKII